MIFPNDIPYLRWALLKLLSDNGGGYWAADGSLQRQLDPLGFKASLDQHRAAIVWLQAQGLVEASNIGETLEARLTQQGLEVVTGALMIPGVQRPLHLNLG